SGHKGTFGTSLLIAGSMYMPGSAALSSIGAIRTGTGRLTVATEASVISTVATHVPEATFTSMSSSLNLLAYDALAIGPGLVDYYLSVDFIIDSLESSFPIFVDVSALHSYREWILDVQTFISSVIIAPHPGEFSVLTGYSIKNILLK